MAARRQTDDDDEQESEPERAEQLSQQWRQQRQEDGEEAQVQGGRHDSERRWAKPDVLSLHEPAEGREVVVGVEGEEEEGQRPDYNNSMRSVNSVRSTASVRVVTPGAYPAASVRFVL